MKVTQQRVLEYLGEIIGGKIRLTPETRLREIFVGENASYYDPILFSHSIFLRLTIVPSDREWVRLLRQGLPIEDGMDIETLEWSDVSEVATFGQLANLILRRIPGPQFQPLNICGKSCRPAGVFRDLISLFGFGERAGKPPIRPSTPLLAVISKSSIWYFWKRLQLFTGDRLPPTRSLLGFWWTKALYAAGLVALPVATVWACRQIDSGTALTGVAPVSVVISYLVLGVLLIENELPPKGIATFRDLSVLIAKTIERR